MSCGQLVPSIGCIRPSLITVGRTLYLLLISKVTITTVDGTTLFTSYSDVWELSICLSNIRQNGKAASTVREKDSTYLLAIAPVFVKWLMSSSL